MTTTSATRKEAKTRGAQRKSSGATGRAQAAREVGQSRQCRANTRLGRRNMVATVSLRPVSQATVSV